MLDVLGLPLDRKSTRLNSSHSQISYAVFCLKNRVPCDRMRPLKRCALASLEAGEVGDVRVRGEVAEAEPLELGLDRSAAEYVLAREQVSVERRGNAGADFLRCSRKMRQSDLLSLWRQARGRVGEELSVSDAPRLDH